ncbi:hypothetical protein [Vulcanisaeta sp. JCM 14467]|uniref:hypothetical protein n=1 Tax=Vulcanisaeta sp. JCM 14467 TaxID=1295370 RepID=UPI002092743C|nr:hypothetical protein [Vulcanisaeta sp. JCM 14467]
MFIGDWEKRLSYVLDVWGIDLSNIRPTYSFKSIKELLTALPSILMNSRAG